MGERACIVAIGLELLDEVVVPPLFCGLNENTPDEVIELLWTLRECILEAYLT